MSVVIPNVGEVELLDKMLKESNEDYTLKLFKNNFYPDASTVVGDFEEADFTNYISVSITRSGWSIALESGKAKGEHSTVPTWTCGATGNTIYGYWLEGATSGTLLWAERFDDEAPLSSGDTLDVTLQFVFYSGN